MPDRPLPQCPIPNLILLAALTLATRTERQPVLGRGPVLLQRLPVLLRSITFIICQVIFRIFRSQPNDQIVPPHLSNNTGGSNRNRPAVPPHHSLLRHRQIRNPLIAINQTQLRLNTQLNHRPLDRQQRSLQDIEPVNLAHRGHADLAVERHLPNQLSQPAALSAGQLLAVPHPSSRQRAPQQLPAGSQQQPPLARTNNPAPPHPHRQPTPADWAVPVFPRD